MSLTDKINEIILHAESAKNHIESLEKGRKASCAKSRADLLKIKNLSHELRKDCMNTMKTIPVKSRVPKVESQPSPEISSPTGSAVVAEESVVKSEPAPKTKRPRTKKTK